MQPGKTITIEDPVESTIPGVNHVQVHEKGGVTFVSALRSILRQDPDVVFVGEMRDPEVSSTAIKAALTGHLVLSTLHTNGVVETFNRLTDMGVEPFLISSTLQLVLAQRLLRRVCVRCAEHRALPQSYIDEFKLSPDQIRTAVHRVATGCKYCLNTGYKGRIAVYELLTPNEEFRRCIQNRLPEDELREAAQRSGMTPLWDAGIQRVLAGETTSKRPDGF